MIWKLPSKGRWDTLEWWKGVKKAVEVLKEEGIIALPTDTIYGMAALSQSQRGIQRLYTIKKRDEQKPVAICVNSIEQIKMYGVVTVSQEVLRELLPGAITVCFERTSYLNASLNPSSSLIGIRIPQSDFIKDVVQECGEPLALTSANRSAGTSPLCLEDFKELWDEIDWIADGGQCSESNLGSTVIDLSRKGYYRIIRKGSALNHTELVMKKYSLHPSGEIEQKM